MSKNKIVTLILFLFSLLFPMTGTAQTVPPFLSNLQATKNSPLFTTYAASMDRSEFTLDEGFHFLFYHPDKGVDWTTDTAGDLCLTFKRGAHYVYKLSEMAQEPVITASYPDLVRYSFYPFADVKVDAFFFVYSSRLAALDLQFTNVGPAATEFSLFPFLRNDFRTFNNISFLKEEGIITFTHEELPDGWTLEHNMPYVSKVHDLLLFSDKAERMTSFRCYQSDNVLLPPQFDLEKKALHVIWGKMSHENGGHCRHQNPAPRLMVILNNDNRRILTETAPRWGSTDDNITDYGYYGLELGNFSGLKDGDVFQATLICPESGQTAQIEGKIENLSKNNNVRSDVSFKQNDFLPIPVNFRKKVRDGGKEVCLYWDTAPDLRFNVYRRDHRKNGYYELVAENSERDFYTDKNLSAEDVYGYVVCTVNEQGRMSLPTTEMTNIFSSDFLTDVKYPDQNITSVKDLARVIAAQKTFSLQAGESKQLRLIRGFAKDESDLQKVAEQAKRLVQEDFTPYLQADEKLFANVPLLSVNDSDLQILYYSAYNLMRQAMLPPEGKSSYNYYVFSREPTWGWGHGGQVFHESITMLAYALMDPQSAMNSQRVYSERQYKNGYINYRTGSFLDEIIEHEGELTSSAPWYAWQNWEVFQITKDKEFLEEMYASSKKFYDFYITRRDKDGDGLCEWGGHGVLECVRDGKVAVWDEVGWPSNFEAVDLNCMLVKEAKALAEMAAELGKKDEAAKWLKEADRLSALINKTFWDEETGFYYQVDKKDHDFTFKKSNDLKRQEIIGFLPIWAGVASKEQAQRLVKHLTNPNKFWRTFGVPSLAADDSYYDPKGYWNGPVWVEWNYLIMDGLLQYGYQNEARELVRRVAANMVAQLKKDHNLWEFYSPDEQWAGYHKTYIWAGIINRMLADVFKQEKP